jgi:hypothetical protein
MAAVVVLALAFPVLSYAWLYRYSGFAMQGRQVLPVLMLIPLAAGEIVHRRLGRDSARVYEWALIGGVAAIAAFQAYAWGYEASGNAGGSDAPAYYAASTYSPPGGWAPWIAVAALGTAALLGFAVAAAVRGSRPRTAPSG